MAEEDAVQRMQVWWVGLDPTTKAMFDQLYANDPEGVMTVVSGGEVAVRPGTLTEILEADDPFAAAGNIATVQSSGDFTYQPDPPDADQPFVVFWTESNSGQADCPAYTDLIQVFDASGTSVFEQSIDRPALAAQASIQGFIQLPGLPLASYNIYVTMNADGIDQGGGQPTAQGFKGYASTQFGVGGAVPGSANSPEEADTMNFTAAYGQLLEAYNSRGDDAIRSVAQALYSFAGVVDTGGVVSDADDYKNDLMVQSIQRAQALEGIAEQLQLRSNNDREQMFYDEVMAALQAIYPLTQDPRRLRDSAVEIQQAIVAIGRNSLGY